VLLLGPLFSDLLAATEKSFNNLWKSFHLSSCWQSLWRNTCKL